MGAHQVRAHGIADGEHPVQWRVLAAPFPRQRHGAFVDRPVRLAVKNYLAAEFAIEFGNRAGAIKQTVSAFDDDIGVGADQRQPAFARLHHQGAIVLRRFGLVIERTGADDVVSALDRGEYGIEAAVDGTVALRTEPVDSLVRMLGDVATRQIAG